MDQMHLKRAITLVLALLLAVMSFWIPAPQKTLLTDTRAALPTPERWAGKF